MHGDLSKSAKDTTLEHYSLFAAFNTDSGIRLCALCRSGHSLAV